jgi:acetolactate synthase-1/2/3 large subunit
VKAAQLFVRCLENEGVEYIFGIPGEENIDVMDALLDSTVEFVTVHHEQGAEHRRQARRRVAESA